MTRSAPRVVARYGLTETARVIEDLRVVRLVIDGVAEADAEPVLAALSRSGRPEMAVAALAALVRAMSESGDSDELLAALRYSVGFRGRLLGVLGGSGTLGDHLVAHPAQWRMLLDPETESGTPSESSETWFAAVTAHQCRRVLAEAVDLEPSGEPCSGTVGARPTVTGPGAVVALRVAYRELLLLIAAADLAPTVESGLWQPSVRAVGRALTDLADALLQTALAVAAAELPAGVTPTRLGVVAMGKCGAVELNYVSDVDVIFIADHVQPTAVGNAEEIPQLPDETAMLATATALSSGMMRICGQVAWEVDASLRPDGKAGPLVRGPAGHRAYYQKWAQTWEFQALLKARPAAGDPELGAEFVAITRPGVWSAARRESFVADVQAMRRRVEDAIPAADRDRELKLGAGGLRDVEFAVQLLQLVHGRADDSLHTPGTLDALDALIDGGYVGRDDGAELAEAYAFLRRVEHLLQLQRLRRTHRLPVDEADLGWLARADGYAGSGTADAVERFSSERLRHAATIRRLHEKLFYRPLLTAVAAVPTEELRLSPDAAATRLGALGFAQPAAALRHIASLTEGVSRRAAIQRTLLPVLLGTFSDSADPDTGLLSYLQVSDALAETPWYLRLLRDEGLVAQRLAALLGESRLVASLLQRAPEVLRLLVDDELLMSVRPSDVATALLSRSERADDAAGAAGAARSARRHEMLRLACADLLGLIDTAGVSSGLTTVAEATVEAALRMATRQCEAERGGCAARLSVIGMGRLGGAELGYSSDADVMFVVAAKSGADPHAAVTDATAIADLLTRLLSRPSPDPPLEIDAGLRPEGRNGPQVRSVESYSQYWERFAEPWERQALLRARPVAGDVGLGEAFVAAADRFRYPVGGLPARDVTEIRRIKARMDNERLPRGADPTTHTKLGRGGLADVEWTIQLLQLRHGAEVAGLRTTHTLGAIEAAREAELMTEDDARALTAGWIAATRARNAIMLVTGRAGDQLPSHGRVLAGIARACGYPAATDPGVFVDDYRRAARRARSVVDRLFDRG
jgi:glutamate-ammonia-ligase adenylyltransferase